MLIVGSVVPNFEVDPEMSLSVESSADDSLDGQRVVGYGSAKVKGVLR